MVQRTMMTVITLSGSTFRQLARRARPSAPVLIRSWGTSLATYSTVHGIIGLQLQCGEVGKGQKKSPPGTESGERSNAPTGLSFHGGIILSSVRAVRNPIEAGIFGSPEIVQDGACPFPATLSLPLLGDYLKTVRGCCNESTDRWGRWFPILDQAGAALSRGLRDGRLWIRGPGVPAFAGMTG